MTSKEKFKQIKAIIKKTEKQIEELKKGKDRKDPVASDIERSLKAMGYQDIVDLLDEE